MATGGIVPPLAGRDRSEWASETYRAGPADDHHQGGGPIATCVAPRARMLSSIPARASIAVSQKAAPQAAVEADRPASIGTGGRHQSECPADIIGIRKLRSGNAWRNPTMKLLMSSCPRRGACSEYWRSISGLASSSMILLPNWASGRCRGSAGPRPQA
jgi:hypothetical protein